MIPECKVHHPLEQGLLVDGGVEGYPLSPDLPLELDIAEFQLALLDVEEVGEGDVLDHLLPLHLSRCSLPPLLDYGQLINSIFQSLL